MRELRTAIEINAPAERVWALLTDFDKYPEWNPFIISVIGRPKLRERIKVTVQPKDRKPMIFKPRVTMLKRNERFAWLGQLFMTGIFDGHHIFEIEDRGNGKVEFVHREQFSGILVPLFWKSLETNTKAGFEAMNLKLKALAEEG